MPQLQVTNDTMNRIKKILGENKIHDGDYCVNKMIDVLEKKTNVRR